MQIINIKSCYLNVTKMHLPLVLDRILTIKRTLKQDTQKYGSKFQSICIYRKFCFADLEGLFVSSIRFAILNSTTTNFAFTFAKFGLRDGIFKILLKKQCLYKLSDLA